MSDGQDQEQVGPQANVPITQFPCANCQTPMMGRIPPIRVFNFMETSGLVLSHERMSKCPNCGTLYVPLIKGLSSDGHLELVFKAIQQPGAIKPPTPDEMRQIEQSRLKTA